jgi:hypothetical protein
MASVSVIYIPSFIKASKGVQQLLGAINGHTYTQQGDLMSTSFKNMEIGQKGKGMTHRYRAIIYI